MLRPVSRASASRPLRVDAALEQMAHVRDAGTRERRRVTSPMPSITSIFTATSLACRAASRCDAIRSARCVQAKGASPAAPGGGNRRYHRRTGLAGRNAAGTLRPRPFCSMAPRLCDSLVPESDSSPLLSATQPPRDVPR